MSTLVAIVSCHKRRDTYLQACADTWVGDPWCTGKAEDMVAGFLGRPVDEEDDSVLYVDVPDDYQNLPYKTVRIAQWAMSMGFDRLVKVDDDCFVNLDQLRQMEQYEYWGAQASHGDYCWGACYGLGPKALQIVANSEPSAGSEDVMVGEWLKAEGIPPHYTDKVVLLPKVGGLSRLNWRAINPEFIAVAELEPRAMHDFAWFLQNDYPTGKGLLVLPPKLYHSRAELGF